MRKNDDKSWQNNKYRSLTLSGSQVSRTIMTGTRAVKVVASASTKDRVGRMSHTEWTGVRRNKGRGKSRGIQPGHSEPSPNDVFGGRKSKNAPTRIDRYKSKTGYDSCTYTSEYATWSYGNIENTWDRLRTHKTTNVRHTVSFAATVLSINAMFKSVDRHLMQ